MMITRNKDQQGQSLVELAITMPILILVLMGILDLGRAYWTYITLSDAAAEGAAYAALYPKDTEQAIARAADSSNGLMELEPEMVTVTWGELSAGNPITVTVEFEYVLWTPIMRDLVGETILMSSSVAQPIIDEGF
jgi:Flp pilus assembly protein TadG